MLYVAIAEKRRIILVKWIVDSLEDVTNINFTPAIFPEVVQKVAWCGNSLVFALRTEYHFVRVFSEDDTTYTVFKIYDLYLISNLCVFFRMIMISARVDCYLVWALGPIRL